MSAARPGALWLVLLAAAILSASSATAQDADVARGEIAALLQAVAGSGCRFERNGRWYDAAWARAHLQRKLAWLEGRGLAASAEEFIERAASASSMSGRAYRVRCPGADALPAAQWFGQRLAALRGTHFSPGGR